MKTFIDDNGAVVIGGTPAEFAAALKADLLIAAKAVKSANIKAE